jgi:hypothetical protein
VRAFDTLSQLRPCAPQLCTLNLASRTPSVFHTNGYLEAVLRHREATGVKALFLVAFDAGRAIGFMALKRRGRTVSLLEPRPPHLVCRKGDEAKVAAAMLEHLVTQTGGWSIAELEAQDDLSPLALASTQLRGVHVDRVLPAQPVMDEACAPSVGAVRALCEAGEVEFLACDDRRATKGMLELYLDLEARSGRASLLRHPARVDRIKAAIAPGRDIGPMFHWLLVDALPIAALVSLRYGGTLFPLDWTCDDAFGALSPCDTLLSLAQNDAATREAELLLPRGDTFTVRLMKRWNLRHLAEHLPGFRRWSFAMRPVSERRAAPAPFRAPDAGRQLRARTRALDMLARMESTGVCVDRLAGDALELVLPTGDDRTRAPLPAALA